MDNNQLNERGSLAHAAAGLERQVDAAPMAKRHSSVVMMVILALTITGALTGCSGYRNYRSAQVAEVTGDWDDAVMNYLELTRRDPANLKYRSSLMRAKIAASHQHFDASKEYRKADLLGQALVELQQAVALDPTNQYAQVELDKLLAEIEALENQGRTETIQEMKDRKGGASAQPPVLNPRSPEPIDLSFPEPRPSKQIYQALGKAFGINVLFDPKMRDQDVAIELKDVSAQDALEILMRTAGHFYKVLDESSIIVVADTPQNRRTYEDLIIQTFFLSNSDVKEVMNQLRSLVDSRKIATNEALNAIILRDTADKVKIAERIIQANDKAKAEVVVDIELLQLNTSKLQDLGLSLSASQIGVTLDTGGADVPVRFNDLQFLNGNNWLLSLPNFMFDFVKTSTDAQTLAKPQLRISEGEQARLRIGDRVPIPVTSFNTANTVGSNVVPITSFQYQDVGILIEIEPRVHHNNEISLKVSIEVSNIAGNVGDQPIIGSRNIETTIRLKDGETNFLAGLIRTDETNSDSGIPGISDIPLIGRLFSSKRSSNQRTDIVLTLTPHIIRRASITEEDLEPIWVGTESNLTFRGGSPRIESDSEGPFEGEEADSGDTEEMRQRLQRLPRGLRPPSEDDRSDEDEKSEESGPPPGQELIPSVRRNPLDRDPPSVDGQRNLSSLEPAFFVPPQLFPGLVGSSLIDLTSTLQLGLAGSAGAGQRVHLNLAAPTAIREDDEFSVKLVARYADGLSHLPARVAFDPQQLELVDSTAGDWFGEGGQAQVLVQANEAQSAAPGELVVGASRPKNAAVLKGGGAVVELRFRVRDGFNGTTRVALLEGEPMRSGLAPMRVRLDAPSVEIIVLPSEVVRPERPTLP